MKIKEAVKIIESINIEKDNQYCVKFNNAKYEAIIALQEKAEREVGCEYCNNREYVSVNGSKKPNYCMNCGRRLAEE